MQRGLTLVAMFEHLGVVFLVEPLLELLGHSVGLLFPSINHNSNSI
jgi:hypothetical protein